MNCVLQIYESPYWISSDLVNVFPGFSLPEHYQTSCLLYFSCLPAQFTVWEWWPQRPWLPWLLPQSTWTSLLNWLLNCPVCQRAALTTSSMDNCCRSKLFYREPSAQSGETLYKLFIHSLDPAKLWPHCVSLPSVPSVELCEVLNRMDALLWLVTEAQCCPLVRAAYLGTAESLRRVCCETYLFRLNETLMHDLQTPQEELQVGDTHVGTSLYKNYGKILAFYLQICRDRHRTCAENWNAVKFTGP